jgi:hypothetical protein
MARYNKKMSTRKKIIIILLFFIVLGLVILFNKATLNSLIPVDYLQDPYPLVPQECPVPANSALHQ